MAASYKTNPPQYAKDFAKCEECGVTWRVDSLVEEKRARGDVFICKDRERCQHWREVCANERPKFTGLDTSSLPDRAVAGVAIPPQSRAVRRGHISITTFNELPEHGGLPPELKAGDRWKTHAEQRGPDCGPDCGHWFLVDTYPIEGQPSSVGLRPCKISIRKDNETNARKLRQNE